MSRLIESFKQSGWEYTFYDDATAAEFLSQHFPPEVREAYDSILPGAFKADLFRYCVLLIKGGVYADMDVLLETNLNEAIASDVGFMTPIDEPGIHVGHRSCLWNGFLAVAPGHPFLARTIEIVVNNIRNRFTSVDYANMLCPNPVLSVLHSVDTLFTCGPCSKYSDYGVSTQGCVI
jgi:mannosyltransferase OCH1-like enzyme